MYHKQALEQESAALDARISQLRAVQPVATPVRDTTLTFSMGFSEQSLPTISPMLKIQRTSGEFQMPNTSAGSSDMRDRYPTVSSCLVLNKFRSAILYTIIMC
jgi:hypothetical protein